MSWQERAEQAERQSYEAASTLLPIPDDQPLNDDKTYLVPKVGESVWDVALKVGLKVPELMEHNGLDTKDPDAYDLTGGTVLHLPYPKDKPKDDIISAEIWSNYKVFYINKTGGARKYAFGHAKVWTDLKDSFSGPTYARYFELRIRGIVTITFSEDRIYQYYLEDSNIDKDTDRVKEMKGWPKEFLTEGEPPTEQNTNTEQASEQETAPEAAEPEIEPQVDPDPVFHNKLPVPPLKSPNEWKSSYSDLEGGPQWCQTKLAVDVEDHDGKRPTTHHFFGRVEIAGTFIKYDAETGEETEYARPVKSAERGSWYGIDIRLLEGLEEEPVDTKDGQDYEITMPDEVRKTVYKGEELFRYVVAKPLAHSVKMMDMAKDKIKNRKII